MNPLASTAVLTGASGGLGRAFAVALAPHCSAMVLVGRDRERLAATARDAVQANRALDTLAVDGDLCAARMRERVLVAAEGFGQPVDLLINNAGISDFHDFGSQRPEIVQRLIDVNLTAPMLLTQTMLPALLRTRRAQIVNVGSIFGYLGYPGHAAYCATKFGLRGYSQALRRELADTPVAVRYFAPRATRTSLNTPEVTAMNRALGTREDDPEQVARLLVRFVSSTAWDRKIGFPERLYVLLNRLVPGINDGAIRGQLQTIRRFLPTAGRPARTAPEGDRP